MKTITLYFFGFAICLMTACSNKNAELVEPQNTSELKKEFFTDLAYSSGTRNKLDVYLPAKRGNNTPFIVLIHGGLWVAGDKKDLTPLQDSLANRGIASINIDYRYASENVHLNDMMADVETAIQYAQGNAKNWSLNLNKIAIGGASSGAQMAMMYAYKYDKDNLIDCIVSAAGPTIFDDRTFLDGAAAGGGIGPINYMVGANYTGGDIDPKFTEASPIKNFKNIPLLMLHGTKDYVVPLVQSQKMAIALTAASIPNKLVNLEGVGHNLDIGKQVSTSVIYQEIDDWLKKYEK